mmetsp:Transcript_21682/g.26679  ORF Transcript_21682/g.26679 Transcript_21682/m.26679 type:complete len:106 (+) Transcript_21682:1276-1593(+)
MMTLCQFEYYQIYFLSTAIGGNSFVNLTIVGVGECLGGFLSGLMMRRMGDDRVFQVSCLLTFISNFVFYTLPAGPSQYACFLIFITGITAQFNTIFVLVELRIPP